jgi:hypothetical protein
MKTTGKHEFLKVAEIELDLTNPRTARFPESTRESCVSPEVYSVFVSVSTRTLGLGDDYEDERTKFRKDTYR